MGILQPSIINNLKTHMIQNRYLNHSLDVGQYRDWNNEHPSARCPRGMSMGSFNRPCSIVTPRVQYFQLPSEGDVKKLVQTLFPDL